MSLVARRPLLSVAVVVVFGAIGVGLSQYESFRREKAEIDAARNELSVVLTNAKTTAARLPEFRTEYERKLATLEALRRILPETLHVATFMAAFHELAKVGPVGVVQLDVTANRHDFYDEAVITVELDGDERAVAELEARLETRSRITHWDAASDDAKRKVALSIYAAPPPPESWDRAPCPVTEDTDSAVWAPPFVAELAFDRERHAELCAELARLEPIADMVEEYQRLLARIEELEILIERLRADR